MTHILLVEDEERIAGFIAKGLQRHGFRVTMAEDGAIALDYLKQQSFDGILLDLGLPRVTGWEVMEELHKRKETTPVIVVTALALEDDQAKAISLGARAYVQKPFRFDQLLHAVEQHI
ncbi:MAG: response regulator [Synechococcales cyanobacterium CRU_2_2]|nr:response regulator [Synechococcales cyanobacterium CRU_2_2]